jgi:hypothetical protein
MGLFGKKQNEFDDLDLDTGAPDAKELIDRAMRAQRALFSLQEMLVNKVFDFEGRDAELKESVERLQGTIRSCLGDVAEVAGAQKDEPLDLEPEGAATPATVDDEEPLDLEPEGAAAPATVDDEEPLDLEPEAAAAPATVAEEEPRDPKPEAATAPAEPEEEEPFDLESEGMVISGAPEESADDTPAAGGDEEVELESLRGKTTEKISAEERRRILETDIADIASNTADMDITRRTAAQEADIGDLAEAREPVKSDTKPFEPAPGEAAREEPKKEDDSSDDDVIDLEDLAR